MKTLYPLALLTTALLAACGTPTPPPTPPTPELQGVIVEGHFNETGSLVSTPWTGGTGTVQLGDGTQDTPEVFQEATLGADGRFQFDTLKAPPTSALTAYRGAESDETCTDTQTISDPATWGTTGDLRVKAGKQGWLNAVTEFKVDETFERLMATMVEMWYVDRPATLSGTLRCTFGQGTFEVTTNLTLKAGWNAIKSSLVQTPSTSSMTMTSTTLGATTFLFSDDVDSTLSAQGMRGLLRPAHSFFR